MNEKSFKVTIDTEEFGRDFTNPELEEFIKERLEMFWKSAKVESVAFYCTECGNLHGDDKCDY